MRNLLITRMMLFVTAISFTVACTKQADMPSDIIEQSNRPAHAGFNENDAVLTWNERLGTVMSRTPAPPPVLARHYTMASLAMHDALNSIVPKYQTYALHGVREKQADPDAAVISAAYWTFKKIDVFLKGFGPTGLPLTGPGYSWDTWYAESMANIPEGEAKNIGIQLGIKAADAIMANRSNDGFATARVVYVNGYNLAPSPGLWRPTIAQTPPIPFPTTHIGGLPYWGRDMKPFAIASASAYRPAAPPATSTAKYAEDYNEVKLLGARTGSTRTADQSEIANFWQEQMSVILNRFARGALLNKKVDAWRSARMLALVNVSTADGFLASFDGLYHFYRWRPETAARNAETDENSATDADASWLPFVTDIKLGPPPQTPTPPIPEYPNPNAVMGGASAEAMTIFFGGDETNVNLVSQDVTVNGTVRNYTSFSQFLDEYGMSRIYAGFNFRYSIEAGTDMGKKIGHYVTENILKEN
jgi:hypothetical protein